MCVCVRMCMYMCVCYVRLMKQGKKVFNNFLSIKLLPGRSVPCVLD